MHVTKWPPEKIASVPDVAESEAKTSSTVTEPGPSAETAPHNSAARKRRSSSSARPRRHRTSSETWDVNSSPKKVRTLMPLALDLDAYLASSARVRNSNFFLGWGFCCVTHQTGLLRDTADMSAV